MKNAILLSAILLMTSLLFAGNDTTVVNSSVNAVTVYFKGAQVSREATLTIGAGKQLLNIVNLPVDLVAQSINVHCPENCQILSVKHIPSTTSRKKNPEVETLQKKIKGFEQLKREIIAKQTVNDQEERLLIDNRVINPQQGSKLAELRDMADFYRQRMTEIQKRRLTMAVTIDSLDQTIVDLQGKVNKLLNDQAKPTGNLILSVDCQKPVSGKLEMTYYVNSAGWVPSYDFRVADVSDPLSIIYLANIFQTSGEEWKNVKIKLSSSDPSLGSLTPELPIWYLGQNVKPAPKRMDDRLEELYPGAGGTLKGKVVDRATQEPIPFANVVVERQGVQIAGTTTDFDGNYVIKPVDPGIITLKVSFVGYETQLLNGVRILTDRVTFQNFEMVATTNSLQEVQVMEYNVPLISKDKTTSGGIVSANEIPYSSLRSQSSKSYATTISGVQGSNLSKKSEEIINTNLISNELQSTATNLEYAIDVPYTIASDGQDYTIQIKEAKVPVNYLFHAVPKLDKNAFLIARLTDWTKLNFISGMINIYYKGTYVGKSVLNMNNPADTLQVSLGRDYGIIITRQQMKEFYEKKVIGNTTKESVGWEIIVKNTRNSEVKIILEDQFPVSRYKSATVELIESSGAKVDDSEGKLTWELTLQPNEKRSLKFQYQAKYPQGF